MSGDWNDAGNSEATITSAGGGVTDVNDSAGYSTAVEDTDYPDSEFEKKAETASNRNKRLAAQPPLEVYAPPPPVEGKESSSIIPLNDMSRRTDVVAEPSGGRPKKKKKPPR